MSVEDSPAYQGHDASELDDAYQSLSPLAVASLLLSLAAPAVFVWPLLLIVPCAAAVLALIAMGKIARSDGVLTGRGLALAAIAISVFCVAGWLAGEQTYARLMNGRAAPVAEAWLERMKEQDARAAFLMTLDPPTRAAAIAHLRSDEQAQGRQEGSPGGVQEGDFDAKIEDFRQAYTARKLLSDQPIESFRLVSRGDVLSASAYSVVVFQTWEVRFQGGANQTYVLRLECRFQKQGPPFWRLIAADPSEPLA
ncbi:MAG: DUF4190 domain-containing protein [Planctomycetales bacterium]|nr:DUF4190 domain-containing protein [Planctomycetales bacterium]